MKSSQRNILARRILPASTLAVCAMMGFSLPTYSQIKTGEFSAAYLGVGDFDTQVGLSTAKDFLYAFNLGSTANVNVNGVTFTAVGGTNPTVAGQFSTTGMGTLIGTGGPNPGGQLGLLTTDFVHGAATTAEVLTLNGLTVGESYVVTFYNSSSEAAATGRRQTMSASGASTLTAGLFTFDQDMGASGQGEFNVLRYTFQATTVQQLISFVAQVSGTTMHQYGFSVERTFNNSFTGGTSWSTSTWSNAIAGTPNAAGRSAAFAAAGAPTSVDMDTNVTLGHLQFDGTNPYTITTSSGSALTLQAEIGGVTTLSSRTAGGNHIVNPNITLNNDLLKVGAGQVTLNGNIGTSGARILHVAGGTLTLNGTSTHTGETIINTGAVLEVATVSDYGVPSGLGARTLAQENNTVTGVGLHMEGGTLRFIGSTPQSTNRHIRFINGTAGGIEANGTNPNATISFTQSGTPINLFDTGGTRTINLGGTNTGANRFGLLITNQGANVTSVTKNGVGTWELSGVSTNTGTTTVKQGTLILSGARTANSGAITVGDTTGQSAILDIRNGTYTVGGTFTIGVGDSTVQGTVNQTAGALTLSGTQMIVGNLTGGKGFYNLSAGTLTGAASGNRGVILGVNTGAQGTFTLSGTGNLNLAGAALQVARSENTLATTTTGIFNQSGGTATVGTLGVGGLVAANNASNSGTMNFTGGTFVATAINAFGGGNNSVATINISGTAQVTLPAFPTARGTGATTTVTFDGGTLKAGAASATYMENLTAAQIKNGGLNFDTNGQAVTINQGLTDFAGHTGSLTKVGAGTLTLGGTSSYTGTTNVNAGALLVSGALGNTAVAVGNNATLNVAGSIGGSVSVASGATVSVAGSIGGSVSVASGGKFGGSGTVAGTVLVAAGGRLAPGASVGTLTVGSLTLAAGSLLDYEFNPAADLVNVTTPGGLTINGGGINLYNEGGTTPFAANGTYTLLDYNTSFTGLPSNLNILNSQAGKFYSLADNAGATTIELTISDATQSEWNGIASDGLWGTGGNWTAGSPNAQGIVARFGAIPVTPTAVAVNGPKTVGGIIFDNANSYTVSGAGANVITLDNGVGAAAINVASGSHTISAPITLVGNLSTNAAAASVLTLAGDISGPGKALALSGAGTMVLTGTNTYDATAIAGGTLAVGAGGTSGTIGGGTVAIATGAFLALNRSDDLTVTNNVTGAGTLVKQNSNNVTLTGTNTFAGLDISAGTLRSGGATAIPGGVAVNVGGTLDLNAFDASVAALTGIGTVTDNSATPGNTTLAYNGTSNFSGTLANGANRTLTLQINGGTLNLDRAADFTVGINITGAGTLRKSGAGITTLSGANSIGGLDATAGTVRAGGATAINTTGTATFTGSTLDLDDFNATVGGLAGTGASITSNGATLGTSTLTVNQAGNTTFGGTIADGSERLLALTKTGAGVLTLAGTATNNFYGGATVTGGTLRLEKAGADAIVSDITIGDASGSDILELGGPDQIGDASVLTFTAGGAGNSAFLRINGFNDTVKGIRTSVGNAAVLENNATAGGTATLTVNTAGASYTYDGIVRNTSVANGSIFALTKAGAGTLTLANTAAVAVNSYTGATTISDGKLVLQNLSGFGATPIVINSSTAGALTVNQATRDLTTPATLSGNGEFVKDGPFTLILTGVGTQTGKTIINDGTLGLGNIGVLGTSEIVMNGGIIRASGAGRILSNPVTVNASFTLGRLTDLLGPITLSADATITANNFDGPANNPSNLGPIGGGFRIGFAEGPQGIGTGSLNITAVNTNTGGTLVTSGRVNVNAAGGLSTGDLTVNGGALNFNNAAQTIGDLDGAGGIITLNSMALTLNHSADTTFAGVIAGTGSINFTQDGELILTGANTFSGLTTIADGGILVTGSLSGSLNVTGGLLGGTGSVGAVTSTGGTIAPGASAGTLTVTSLALDSTSYFNFELATPGIVGSGVNDLLTIGGALTLDGTLGVTELPGFGNGTYRLANYGGTLTDNGLDLTGAFLAAYPGSSVDTTTVGQVNLVVVPEPGSAALILGGLALLARRRRMESTL